jgi:hypothetical protein
MKQTKVWRDYATLPPELQNEVADFIAFLKMRSLPPQIRRNKRTKLASEPFVGMWRNRKDMQDSRAWVRNVREREWSKHDG